MWEVGYLGIWRADLANLGARQISADLVILGTLLLALLWRDARTSGRRFWPYVGVTYLAGSFGPILHLLLGDRRQRRTDPPGHAAIDRQHRGSVSWAGLRPHPKARSSCALELTERHACVVGIVNRCAGLPLRVKTMRSSPRGPAVGPLRGPMSAAVVDLEQAIPAICGYSSTAGSGRPVTGLALDP